MGIDKQALQLILKHWTTVKQHQNFAILKDWHIGVVLILAVSQFNAL